LPLLRRLLSLAFFLALSGCGALAPMHERARPLVPPKGVPAPERHAADRRLVPPDLWFTMEDGARLPARAWRPAGRPRAVILALHGFNDSRDAWEIPAPDLAARGIAVYAPDQRGFGGAPGRGRWAGTARMVADAAFLARLVAAREPGVPLYLMGESMGGAVAMCLAGRADHPPVAGFILLAPAVWSRAQMSPAETASLWAASTFLPDWKLTGRELPLKIVATDNRAALYRLAYDPLTLPATRTATLRGLVDLMTAAQDAAAHVHGRMLLAYGGRDALVPPRATAASWRRLPAEGGDAGPDAIRRSFYPHGYHLLMRDTERRLVIDDVVSWILDPAAPLPSGGDVAAAAWTAGDGWDADVPLLLPGNLDALAGG